MTKLEELKAAAFAAADVSYAADVDYAAAYAAYTAEVAARKAAAEVYQAELKKTQRNRKRKL